VVKPGRSDEHEFAAFTNGRSFPLGNGAMTRVLFDALMNYVRRRFDKGEAIGEDSALRLA
jgi:hypothetical protein